MYKSNIYLSVYFVINAYRYVYIIPYINSTLIWLEYLRMIVSNVSMSSGGLVSQYSTVAHL